MGRRAPRTAGVSLLVLALLAAGLVAPAGAAPEPPASRVPSPVTPPSAQPSTEPVAGEIVVMVPEGTSKRAALARARAAGGARVREATASPAGSFVTVKVTPGAERGVVAALRADPALGQVSRPRPVVLAGTDPYPTDPWQLEAIGARRLWEEAEAGAFVGSASTVIAVVDTGVTFTDPELPATRHFPGRNIRDPGSPTTDSHGHGTKVASVAAATRGNDEGIAGLCDRCKVMPVKVVDVLEDQQVGSTADLAMGIEWAADHGADVINVSAGALADAEGAVFPELVAAVNHAVDRGVPVVAAAGNADLEATQPGDAWWPAAYEPVIAVAGSQSDDNKLGISEYGPDVDLAAPGQTWAIGPTGSPTAVGGTSYAAPFVTGVAALLLAAGAGPQGIDALLRRTADPVPGDYVGGGRLNAFRAADALQAPSATLSSPSHGAIVRGNQVPLEAVVADQAPSQVTVTFTADGQPLTPGATAWDTTTSADGPHELAVIAVDSGGNTTVSAPVTVRVDNRHPEDALLLTAPADGGTVGGQVQLVAEQPAGAEPLTGPVTFEITEHPGVVGQPLLTYSVAATSAESPFTATWDTRSLTVPEGDYTIVATAGAVQSVEALVTVDNTAPAVTLTAPDGAAPVEGTGVLIVANVSDASPVESVTFRLGDAGPAGGLSDADGDGTWQAQLDTRGWDGTHTLTVTATDAAGNAATDTVDVVIDNPGTPPSEPVTALAALAGDGQVTLSWALPADADGVEIRQAAGDAAPLTLAEGTPVDGGATQVTITGLSNEETYSWAVFAYAEADGTRAYARPATLTWRPGAASATLALDRPTIPAGDGVRLRGKVMGGDGSPLAGATVGLQRRPVTSRDWEEGATATTGADGAVSFDQQPAVTTDYRLRVEPTAHAGGATSPAVTVAVVPTLSVAPVRALAGRPLRVTVTASAPAAGGTEVVVQRGVDRAWEDFGRAELGADGTATVVTGEGLASGRYRLRVRLAGSTVHPPAVLETADVEVYAATVNRLYDGGPSTRPNREWFEVENTGVVDLDLENWTVEALRGGDVVWSKTLSSYRLTPGRSMKVRSGKGTPAGRYLGRTAELWTAARNTVRLRDGNSQVVGRATAPRLAVMETHARAGRPLADEWVQLRNVGAVAVDLRGWRLRSASGRKATLSAPQRLRPAQKLRIHTGRGRNRLVNGIRYVYLRRGEWLWRNGAETATLRDTGGLLRARRNWR